MKYFTIVKNEEQKDDGLRIDMGSVKTAWWCVPLPNCPDCGGHVVWWEAEYVSGTRKCLGHPKNEPTSILDARVPQPGNYPNEVAEQVERLIQRRNTCPDEEVAKIDLEILRLLRPWTEGLQYDTKGGCGSLFSVQSENGRVYLRRERFYP